MDNDSKTLALSLAAALAAFTIGTVAIVGQIQRDNDTVRELVNKGASPAAAACAVGRMNRDTCAILFAKEQPR